MSGLHGLGMMAIITCLRHVAWCPKRIDALNREVILVESDGQAHLMRCHDVLLGLSAVVLVVLNKAPCPSASVIGMMLHVG